MYDTNHAIDKNSKSNILIYHNIYNIIYDEDFNFYWYSYSKVHRRGDVHILFSSNIFEGKRYYTV